MPNKYLSLRRSQIVVRLLQLENELLARDGRGRVRVRFGSARHTELQRERSALFDALRVRDAEIIAHWHAGLPVAQRRDLR